ncbi:MAG: hypothetical protein ACR2PA_07795 [Hyphomicrobiaceae bacterium]
MTVAKFHQFLLQLAQTCEEVGERDEAAALRKLAEVFDARQNQQNVKVTKFVNELRKLGITKAA